jgi:hypothetical protein
MSIFDLPGKRRREQAREQAALAAATNSASQMSIEKFAERIVELLVIDHALPSLRSILAEGGAFNEPEALNYSLFPFHVMLGSGHFKSDALPLASALISSAAHFGHPQTSETVTSRFREYGTALFEANAISKGRLSAAKDGPFRLARCACRHILHREIQDIALLYEVGAVWHAEFTAYHGGATLKKLFDEYMQLRFGDDDWVHAIRLAVAEGVREARQEESQPHDPPT